MPKQKYYYAVVDKKTKRLLMSLGQQWLIFGSRKKASEHCDDYSEVVSIPADSLHKLILSHANKKAK